MDLFRLIFVSFENCLYNKIAHEITLIPEIKARIKTNFIQTLILFTFFIFILFQYYSNSVQRIKYVKIIYKCVHMHKLPILNAKINWSNQIKDDIFFLHISNTNLHKKEKDIINIIYNFTRTHTYTPSPTHKNIDSICTIDTTIRFIIWVQKIKKLRT